MIALLRTAASGTAVVGLFLLVVGLYVLSPDFIVHVHCDRRRDLCTLSERSLFGQPVVRTERATALVTASERVRGSGKSSTRYLVIGLRGGREWTIADGAEHLAEVRAFIGDPRRPELELRRIPLFAPIFWTLFFLVPCVGVFAVAWGDWKTWRATRASRAAEDGERG